MQRLESLSDVFFSSRWTFLSDVRLHCWKWHQKTTRTMLRAGVFLAQAKLSECAVMWLLSHFLKGSHLMWLLHIMTNTGHNRSCLEITFILGFFPIKNNLQNEYSLLWNSVFIRCSPNWDVGSTAGGNEPITFWLETRRLPFFHLSVWL